MGSVITRPGFRNLAGGSVWPNGNDDGFRVHSKTKEGTDTL